MKLNEVRPNVDSSTTRSVTPCLCRATRRQFPFTESIMNYNYVQFCPISQKFLGLLPLSSCFP